MLKKTFSYYKQTFIKRFWAYYYFVNDNLSTTPKKKRSDKIKQEFENQKLDLSFKLKVDNSFFYPYAFFDHPDDIASTIKKNKEGYVIAFKGYAQEEPLLLYTAYYGLLNHNHYLVHKTQEVKELIFLYANFIVSQMNDDGSVDYPVDFSLFEQKAPWQSGIAQAIVTSFLIRAHLHFPETKFLKYAELSLNFMLSNQKLQVLSNEGLPWIEEYPMKKPSLVLNGFIFSIISIIEFGSLTENKKYNNFSKIYLSSLIKSLHRYLYPNGIRHNLYQIKFGNANYDALHAFLFYHLFKITGNHAFYNIAKRYFKITNWQLFYDVYNLNNSTDRKQKLEMYFK